MTGTGDPGAACAVESSTVVSNKKGVELRENSVKGACRTVVTVGLARGRDRRARGRQVGF